MNPRCNAVDYIHFLIAVLHVDWPVALIVPKELDHDGIWCAGLALHHIVHQVVGLEKFGQHSMGVITLPRQLFTQYCTCLGFVHVHARSCCGLITQKNARLLM